MAVALLGGPMASTRSTPPEAERVGDALREAGTRVAVAETCTGGLVGSILTAVPGSSEYFERSLVPYSYDSLRDLIGIERETLDEHGVISEPVTRQLARRARDMGGTTWGLSTTGIAGPDGGSAEKPVGTGFVGVAYAAPWETGSSYAIVVRDDHDGDRATIRRGIARSALEALLEELQTGQES